MEEIMRQLDILSLGSFILAAAHYAKDGDSGYYAVYVVVGCILAVASGYVRKIKKDRMRSAMKQFLPDGLPQ
ncbi:MAG: hypothetical protein KGL39_06490 [Patescibacteria group bacterium]|nr:hypothetical protein [Patescibacteria group bacterium]